MKMEVLKLTAVAESVLHIEKENKNTIEGVSEIYQ
jgi:hypothetical protein